jgi:hypothetical protein
LFEAPATWIYRAATHRPFSAFWTADAVIAGCLAGAVSLALVLHRLAQSDSGARRT